MATRKINVINANPVRSGPNANGGTWTLYEIDATDPEGSPIDLKLKSFDQLDGEVEVEVEKQEHEKYGTSYMLRPAGSRSGGGGGGNPGARLGPKVDELREHISVLENRVTDLVARVVKVEALTARVDRLEYALQDKSPSSTDVAPAAPAGDEDDDIPF